MRRGRAAERWRFVGGLRLGSDDEHNGWLRARPALLEGEFNTETGRGKSRGFTLDGQE